MGSQGNSIELDREAAGPTVNICADDENVGKCMKHNKSGHPDLFGMATVVEDYPPTLSKIVMKISLNLQTCCYIQYVIEQKC